jgi:hypothetical protein
MISVLWILHLLINGLQEVWHPVSQYHWILSNEDMWKTFSMLCKSNYLWQIMDAAIVAIILNMLYLYCLHPVLYHDLWYNGSQHNNKNKTIELFTLVLFNNCYMFRSTVGPSSGIFIKYVSCYWNILIWIHISVKHYNHIVTCMVVHIT